MCNEIVLCSSVEGEEIDKEQEDGVEKKRLLVSKFLLGQERASAVR